MMRTFLGILVSVSCLQGSDLTKPQKLSINTWVREDIFAGWMANDIAGLERGERKLEVFLAAQPEDRTGLAWQYMTKAYRARRASQTGDIAGYKKWMEGAIPVGEKALAAGGDPANAGPPIIVGGTMVMLAFYAPIEDREKLYREGREILRRVPKIQKAYFDTLPPHMRGELWSLMAFASDRLGDRTERDRLIQEMAEKLAGSVYEGRAKRWASLPALNSEVDNMCISCHEPGRLKPMMTKLGLSH